MYENDTSVGVLIKNIDMSEKVDDVDFAPYSEVYAYVTGKYGNFEDTEVLVQAVYSTSVCEGYIVPCYRFYLNNTIDNSCKIVEVTNIE